MALVHRFGALLDAGRHIATRLDRVAILTAVEQAAGDLLQAEHCALFEVGDDGRPRLVRGDPGPAPAGAALARALEGGRTTTVGDGDSLVDGGLRAVLCAPVHVRGRAVACLYAARQGAAKVFGDEARRIADFLATLTGAALENAVGFEEAARLSAALEQRAAEVRRLGEALARSQEEERRQVALTLHDGVGQSLVALSMRVHAMRGGERDERRARALDEVVALVEHLCQEMRRISHDLRPSVLDIFGLPEALRDVAESLSTEARPVALEVEPPELGALPDEVAVTLFRVAQSALANAALHADAGRITVRLAGTADHVRLDVEDDGVGFDPAEAARRGGIGLIGMRERVAWLGGRFDVASAPGAGTRVRVELPLDAAGR
jgi:signal transduction histidine kinase